MRSFQFAYKGKVRGQGRPRFANGHAFKAKEDRLYEESIRDAFYAGGGFKMEGPVSVTITVQRSMPKNRPAKMQSEPDVFKPDSDNVAKAVLDALNGEAWEDDSQIVHLSVRKMPRKRCEEGMFVNITEVRS